ncbi:recombinase family protein [Pseudofrankia sp. BMG5.36]|uniref:recombinase family protein n=1 Tax=Pseudofrankia sp. BMG5.36 TaxID=1834512 RepID=UPI001F51C437|nr:recombinase family protein [Pseudofrankia sp. BMG5.36]
MWREQVMVLANMVESCWEAAVNGASKITGLHRSRTAAIYLRQSTLMQVRDNTASTLRQYGLVDLAVELGWPRENVRVIDADLGVSGRFGADREGFRDLVAQVCLGEVGAIFGLEVSRLARSSADFARLLELARLTDALLVDADGVYDLADFNDRLLLGLKGSMSEALCRRRHKASLIVPFKPSSNRSLCSAGRVMTTTALAHIRW